MCGKRLFVSSAVAGRTWPVGALAAQDLIVGVAAPAALRVLLAPRGRSPAERVTLQGIDGKTRALEGLRQKLDDGLRELYGERHRGLVLYGSHAREEAYDASDVDLLLLLGGEVVVGTEIRRSSGLVTAPSLEAGRVLSVVPVSVEDYRAASDPYPVNARREGRLLSPVG